VVEEAWVDTAEFAMAASGKTPIRHRGAWIKEMIIDVVPKEPEETLGGRVPVSVGFVVNVFFFRDGVSSNISNTRKSV